MNTAVAAIKHGSSELAKGIANFQDGSLNILNGMEGIDKQVLIKLANVIEESETVLPRLKATVEITKKYQSFSGINPATKGNVRFIYRTSSI